MDKPLLCLNMIVKNEADIIENTLMNIVSKLPIDYWVICDTGSTDGTQEIIKSFFNFIGVKGELYEDKWVDFAHNRTKALQYAFNKSKYLMTFDADDKIIGNIVLPQKMDKDGYILQMKAASTHFERIFIVKNDIKWVYKGVLHEHIFAVEGNPQMETITGDYYIGYNMGGKSNRNKDNTEKYKNDAEILEKAYYEAFNANDSIYKRYTYYLAQSLCWSGDYEKAIEWYKKCLEIPDLWVQEKYISCLNIHDCYCKLNREIEGIPYLLESVQYDKTRLECMYQLIKYYTIKSRYALAYELYCIVNGYYEKESRLEGALKGKLLLETESHNFYLPYYMIIVVTYVDKYEIGVQMYKTIFKNKVWPIDNFYLNNLLFNINLYLSKVPDIGEEFYMQLKEYLLFISKNGYIINVTNKELLQKLIDSDKLESYWINK